VLALALACGGALTGVVLAGNGPPPGGSSTDTSTSTTPTEPAPTTTSTTPVPTTPSPQPPVRLPVGVTIAGVHVGGLSPGAAYAVVRAAFNAPLRFVLPGAQLTVSPAALGAVAYVLPAVRRAEHASPGASIPLPVAVHGDPARAYIRSLAKRYKTAAVDANVFLRSLRPHITKGTVGHVLDAPAALRAIVHALEVNSRTPLALPARTIPQKVNAEHFGPVIVIRRGSNRLFLYRGVKFWRVFHVATGQSVYPTPLGHFAIAVMWRNPWWYPPNSPWAAGSKPIPPGPGNPLGTRWMGLTAPGVGIHGTPDPASIGYSASHGCIRMYIPQAEWLFDHVAIGTPVFIVSA